MIAKNKDEDNMKDMEDLKKLEEVLKLMHKYQVSHVEVAGMIIDKHLHDIPVNTSNEPDKQSNPDLEDEDMLFYSS
jgi:hypothetical protein